MNDRKAMIQAALAAVLLAGSTLASAALVTSRAALGGDDTITWGQLAQADPLTPLASPAAVTSALGRSASVRNTAGSLYQFNEGDGIFGGQFTTGDGLLFTFFDGGSIEVDFAATTGRAGAQIQGGSGQAFRARIEAFASNGSLLEAWELDGAAVDLLNLGDGSNLFIGISRPGNDIDRIAFSVSYPSDPNLTDLSVAINQLSFGPAATGPTDLPEPHSLALAALALAAGGTLRGRSRAR